MLVCTRHAYMKYTCTVCARAPKWLVCVRKNECVLNLSEQINHRRRLMLPRRGRLQRRGKLLLFELLERVHVAPHGRTFAGLLAVNTICVWRECVRQCLRERKCMCVCVIIYQHLPATSARALAHTVRRLYANASQG